MTDYISREAAIEAMYKDAESHPGHTFWVTQLEALLNIPAADVRSVVLCRDCVNYVEDGEDNGEKMCVIDAEWCVEDGCYYGFKAYTPPDWFCAGGKKREES